MRKREDLRSQEEIALLALREWMEREYGQPTDRGYQWKDLFLPHGTRLRDIYVRRNYREAWTHASDLRAGAARHPLINRRQRARRSTD